MTRMSRTTKFVVGGSLAALVLVGCGSSSTDTEVAATTPEPTTEATPEPTPEAVSEPKQTIETCDTIGDAAIELSQENDIQIVGLYDLELVEDNVDDLLAGSLEFDGNLATVRACEGDVVWTDTTESGIRVEWVIDSNGDGFVGYEELMASP